MKLSAKITLFIISRLCLVPEISVTPPPKTPDPSPLPEEVLYFYPGDFWLLVIYIRVLLIPWSKVGADLVFSANWVLGGR